MKSKTLRALGIPEGALVLLTQTLLRPIAEDESISKAELKRQLSELVDAPAEHLAHPHFAALAEALVEYNDATYEEREVPAPWRQWGDDLDDGAIQQMINACRLPVAAAGALMPDAHRGYGLPIGGVLATEGAIIPYAVGVDIACRMKMSILDMPASAIDDEKDRLINVLQRETQFGVGATFRRPKDHDVLDLDWDVSPITKRMKNKARSQLGTSGSGNHFVEFGTLTITTAPDGSCPATDALGLPPGTYLALLSHSGSRGTGATVAAHYAGLAKSLHPELPKELRHLSWLDMDREEGQEYFAAMNLMGEYAAANHAVIHRECLRALGTQALAQIENHHNFAWKEIHDGKEYYVHRKGATPAGEGVLGIIPGSMATPAYVVQGKGSAASLQSAAHGAGRVMSRTQAKKTFAWSDITQFLRDKQVTLLSAGIDEIPLVYKDIDTVMAQQQDLVDSIARFDPRIVKMAQAGEPPED